MIRSYKYLDTAVQLKLHEFIIAFFDRIEFESTAFDNSFFGADFIDIVNGHPKILKKRCIQIYNYIKDWDQNDKSNLCLEIRDSNNIENICGGNYIPPILDRNSTGINKLLRDLFLDLYSQVLDGDVFNLKYKTTLRTHFNDFCKLNFDITLCPICGIGELKKHTDLARDQYDHYLPKSLYPFSAINFKNLVPICIDCNSLNVKGSKDIIAESTNHKLFFLYDQTYQNLTVAFKILTDNINPNNIKWHVDFINPDNKIDEIESWKTIYKIEGRYIGYVNARIEKWYSHYWEYFNRSIVSSLDSTTKKLCYDAFLEIDQEKSLNFIRKPALTGFLEGSTLSNATIEASYYSLAPPHLP